MTQSGRKRKAGQSGDNTVDVLLPNIPTIGVAETTTWLDTQYMGVAVGVLVTVILILVAVIAFIMYKNSKAGLSLQEEGVKGNMEGVEDKEWSRDMNLLVEQLKSDSHLSRKYKT